MTTSSEVSWQLDGITMHGTVVRPDGGGRVPAAVLVAGSGPTDRDWCSPLLPGTNGSARLLADALADAGIASLRYDKRGSGPSAAEDMPRLIGRLSMQSYLDELVAAVGVLADQESVDAARIVGLGNSEAPSTCFTTPHESAHPVRRRRARGPARSTDEGHLAGQLALQAAQVPAGAELMSSVRAATAQYESGEPMDLDPRLSDTIKMVLSSFETPANLPLARELWSEDATRLLPNVGTLTLVLIGGHDLQVDQHADGDPLQAAAAGMSDIAFAFPPTANHVLKEDTRTAAEVIATPGNGYNADAPASTPRLSRRS